MHNNKKNHLIERDRNMEKAASELVSIESRVNESIERESKRHEKAANKSHLTYRCAS